MTLTKMTRLADCLCALSKGYNMNETQSFILSQKYHEKLLAVTKRITIFAIHYIMLTKNPDDIKNKNSRSAVCRQPRP